MTSKPDWTPGAGLCSAVAVLALILLNGCGTTRAVGGDAGCPAYGEMRLVMPDAATVPAGKWGEWIADLDDRMTGTCR